MPEFFFAKFLDVVADFQENINKKCNFSRKKIVSPKILLDTLKAVFDNPEDILLLPECFFASRSPKKDQFLFFQKKIPHILFKTCKIQFSQHCRKKTKENIKKLHFSSEQAEKFLENLLEISSKIFLIEIIEIFLLRVFLRTRQRLYWQHCWKFWDIVWIFFAQRTEIIMKYYLTK